MQTKVTKKILTEFAKRKINHKEKGGLSILTTPYLGCSNSSNVECSYDFGEVTNSGVIGMYVNPL
ncbi:hypothetical protein ACFLUF_01455 [Chloroflexota bacterium]